MKREICAGLLLLALLAGAFWNLRCMDNLIGDLRAQISDSMEAAENGDKATAGRLLDGALADWLAADVYTNIFFRHPEIDAVSDAFYELKQQLDGGNGSDLRGAYGLLLYHLDSINLMEHPRLGSIL